MVTLLQLAGFGEIYYCEVGESKNPNLKNVEKHGIKLTEDFNKLETSCIEAIK